MDSEMHPALPERQVMRRRVNDVEMAEVVPSARQQHHVADAILLHDVRRDVTDRQPDARRVRSVRSGAVHDADVMQREFTRLKDEVERAGLVDLYRDLLATRQHVCLGIGLPLRQQAAVRPGDHAHAAVFARARHQRDPRGRDVEGRQSPVGGVLVPGHVRLVTREFRKPLRAPDDDVRAQDRFHGVQDPRTQHHVAHPPQKQVSVDQILAPLARRLAVQFFAEGRPVGEK